MATFITSDGELASNVADKCDIICFLTWDAALKVIIIMMSIIIPVSCSNLPYTYLQL